MDAQTPELAPNSLPKVAAGAPSAVSGWRGERGTPSLADMFASVGTARKGPFWRKLLAFLGPGYLVAVGYMDPGNWATSLAGGSKFGYALLSVALLSNAMAIMLAVAVHAARGWRRTRPGAGLPRFISALGLAAVVAFGGTGDHRD